MQYIYLLSCLFKILFDVQYWEENHETYHCYFSPCHWRKFSWGNRILLFCSVNANHLQIRSMSLSEHFCLSIIFSSWLIFDYLLKRHLTLILKFLDFLDCYQKPDCPPWCSVSIFRFSTFCHWLIEDTSSPATESVTSGRDRQAAEENLIK